VSLAGPTCKRPSDTLWRRLSSKEVAVIQGAASGAFSKVVFESGFGEAAPILLAP